MALRSNASTTSLMNDARSPSGNHSRMSGGNNNRWSCEYGRKRWVMSHTLLARAPLTQHFQSDRLLALLEVGASAGLCLLLDRYAYEYEVGESQLTIGDGPVRLRCAARGPVPIPRQLP